MYRVNMNVRLVPTDVEQDAEQQGQWISTLTISGSQPVVVNAEVTWWSVTVSGITRDKVSPST